MELSSETIDSLNRNIRHSHDDDDEERGGGEKSDDKCSKIDGDKSLESIMSIIGEILSHIKRIRREIIIQGKQRDTHLSFLPSSLSRSPRAYLLSGHTSNTTINGRT